MLEGLRSKIGQNIGEFQRNWLNIGYVDHLIRTQDETKHYTEVNLPFRLGQIAARASRAEQRTDEAVELFREQLIDRDNKRITTPQEITDAESADAAQQISDRSKVTPDSKFL